MCTNCNTVPQLSWPPHGSVCSALQIVNSDSIIRLNQPMIRRVRQSRRLCSKGLIRQTSRLPAPRDDTARESWVCRDSRTLLSASPVERIASLERRVDRPADDKTQLPPLSAIETLERELKKLLVTELSADHQRRVHDRNSRVL